MRSLENRIAAVITRLHKEEREINTFAIMSLLSLGGIKVTPGDIYASAAWKNLVEQEKDMARKAAAAPVTEIPASAPAAAPNMSDAIRDAFRELTLDAKPSAVEEHLKAKGITVNKGLINSVKTKLRKETGRPSLRKPRVAKASKNGIAVGDPIALIESAKNLIEAAGGKEQAAKLIGLL